MLLAKYMRICIDSFVFTVCPRSEELAYNCGCLIRLVAAAEHIYCGLRAYARGWGGVNPPLSLKFYKNFITFTKDINCFYILFAMPLNEPPMKIFCVRHCCGHN